MPPSLVRELLIVSCDLFVSLGLVQPSRCTDFISLEDQRPTVSWAKLMFAPLICLLLLGLFVLESYSSRTNASRNRRALLSSQSKPLRHNEDFWKKYSARNRAKQRAGDRSFEDPIRLSLLDSEGNESKYKIAPSTTIKEVITFYCHRHDTPRNAVCLMHNGRVLNSSDTVLEAGLTDLSHIIVETDFTKMYFESKKEAAELQAELSLRVEAEAKGREEVEDQLAAYKQELRTQKQSIQRLQAEFKHLSKSNENLKAKKDKLERDVKTHQTHRRAAEKALRSMQEEMAGDKEHKEKLKNEKLVAKLQGQVEERDAQIANLEQEVLKAKAFSQMKDQHKIFDLQQRIASLERQNALQKDDADLQGLLDEERAKTEQARQELVTWMMRTDKLEQQLKGIEDTKAELLARQTETEESLSRAREELKEQSAQNESLLSQVSARDDEVEQLLRQVADLKAKLAEPSPAAQHTPPSAYPWSSAFAQPAGVSSLLEANGQLPLALNTSPLVIIDDQDDK